MTSPVSTITSNVNLLLVDSYTIVNSNEPYIAYVSSVAAPGKIATVRDSTGNLGTNFFKIRVSTTKGVSFTDGTNYFDITQPFGYVTMSSRDKNTWNILNAYAFPDPYGISYVSTVNVRDRLTTPNVFASSFVSSVQLNTNSISTNNIYASNAISTNNLFANTISSLNIRATNISTTNLFVNTISTTNINTTTISTTNLFANSFSNLNMNTSNISTTNLATNSISTININASNISTANLVTNSVSTLNIRATNISTNILVANTISSINIRATTLSTTSLNVSSMNVYKISTNTIDASVLNIDNFTVNNILTVNNNINTLGLRASQAFFSNIINTFNLKISDSLTNTQIQNKSNILYIGNTLDMSSNSIQNALQIGTSSILTSSITTSNLYTTFINNQDVNTFGGSQWSYYKALQMVDICGQEMENIQQTNKRKAAATNFGLAVSYTESNNNSLEFFSNYTTPIYTQVLNGQIGFIFRAISPMPFSKYLVSFQFTSLNNSAFNFGTLWVYATLSNLNNYTEHLGKTYNNTFPYQINSNYFNYQYTNFCYQDIFDFSSWNDGNTIIPNLYVVNNISDNSNQQFIDYTFSYTLQPVFDSLS